VKGPEGKLRHIERLMATYADKPLVYVGDSVTDLLAMVGSGGARGTSSTPSSSSKRRRRGRGKKERRTRVVALLQDYDP